MANQDNLRNDTSRTFVRETRTSQPSGTGLALIIGGLVVAVGFIIWLVFGGEMPATSPVSSTETTNVTVEAPPAATSDDVTIETAPAAPAETAPADPVETAPADTAPVEPAPAETAPTDN